MKIYHYIIIIIIIYREINPEKRRVTVTHVTSY